MNMKTKPYPPYEEQPMVAGEPTAACQRTDPATYRTSHSSKCGYTQEEPDEMEDENLRPFTWEEARQWIAEAEAEEDSVPHKEVMREMREMVLAYGN